MIKYLSHILVLLLSVFILSSCFGIGDGSGGSGAGLSSYSGEGFKIDIPASWQVLDSESGALPSPSSGDIALAVSSPDARNGFSNNFVILKEVKDTNLNSKEFSQVTHTSSEDDYYSYDKTSSKILIFSDEEESMLYTFKAKYNKNTPTLHFLQTARICVDETYVLTIALHEDTTGLERYEGILKTFQCK